jgi:H+/gluconate symporter-like permease
VHRIFTARDFTTLEHCTNAEDAHAQVLIQKNIAAHLWELVKHAPTAMHMWDLLVGSFVKSVQGSFVKSVQVTASEILQRMISVILTNAWRGCYYLKSQNEGVAHCS